MSEIRAKLVGINHIALEVGNLEEALAFVPPLDSETPDCD